MSDYAQQVWKDSAGHTHDTEGEAIFASRRNLIRLGMERQFLVGDQEPAAGLRWFLADPLGIIGCYKSVCDTVDGQMTESPCKECNGSGYFKDELVHANHECPVCKGKGRVSG